MSAYQEYKDYLLDVQFYPEFLTADESLSLFEMLYNLDSWGTRKIRSNIIYGDIEYKEGLEKKSLPWDPQILKIKEKIEKVTGILYNICIVNYYPNGNSGIGHHKDRELMIGTHICGISLGATRTLQLKRFSEEYNIPLPDGSLYILKGVTNEYWSHSILKDNTEDPRISLTFRNYKPREISKDKNEEDKVFEKIKVSKIPDIPEILKIKIQA